MTYDYAGGLNEGLVTLFGFEGAENILKDLGFRPSESGRKPKRRSKGASAVFDRSERSGRKRR